MQFDFNLGPGASQTIDVKGRFFKYKAGNGLIRVRVSGGGAVDLLPGQGIENVLFTSLTVSDRSGAGSVGSILAGDFDFRDDRINGAVEVNDVVGAGCQYLSPGGPLPTNRTIVPVVAAGVAKNGIIVRHFNLYMTKAGTGGLQYNNVAFFAASESDIQHTVARTNTQLICTFNTNPADGKTVDSGQIARRFPSGWGLYLDLEATGGGGSAYRLDISLEIL